MFKVGKLNEIKKETIKISRITHSIYNLNPKLYEEFKTLSFEINGKDEINDYSLSFDLNCKLEELLNIPNNKTIDFNKYISAGETIFNLNDLNGVEAEMRINVNRYLKNKFLFIISFEATIDNDTYYGSLEFEFNLDDYLNKD